MSHGTDVVQVIVTPTPTIVVTPAPEAVVTPTPILVVGSVNNSFPGEIAYHHVQGASSTVWQIWHGLDFYPNVTTMDSGGSIVEGELEHINRSTARVTFSVPISGNAYLS